MRFSGEVELDLQAPALPDLIELRWKNGGQVGASREVLPQQ
jgi:hypothetical protein